jgi:molybdopterin-dependent oxidoreductase alpha subunit
MSIEPLPVTAETPKRQVMLVPPALHRDLILGPPGDKAVGLTAVKEALRHLRMEMGLVTGLRVIAHMNQKNGFDCSGCAWPDSDGHRSGLGEYCENGAKALAEEATEKRVTPEFFARHSVEELSSWQDYELGKSGRITHPMYLAAGSSHYEPITWADAFQKIGSHLRGLASPDEAVFYTSGRTSNEAAFMYQLFVRAFGTNNLPDCSNMCHESSGTALSATVGIGKGSVTLEDIHIASLILVIGQNPGTNHPRMLSALKKCKDNGGLIISINPLEEAGLKTFIDPQSPMQVFRGGTKIADMHLPVRLNGDVALLKGIMKLLLEMDERDGNAFDHAFIAAKTSGFADFLTDLRATDMKRCIEDSGISLQEMQKVAQLVARNEKIIVCWAMGLTQHTNAVGNIQEIVNLLLLRGAIGKPGAGTCPVRGHSNVQGDRTMGIYEKPKESFLAALDRHFRIQSPRAHGYDTVEAIRAMRDGQAKVFVSLGGNFASATPDSAVTAAALQNCALTVQISTKLNRSHVLTGREALILPCIARSEEDLQPTGVQFISVENSMGVVHSSRGAMEPASPDLLSEPRIVAEMAIATLPVPQGIDWQSMADNYDKVRDHIEAVIPGFEDFNHRVRQAAGFYLPNGAREGQFFTSDGRAHFTINPIPDHTLAPGHFAMMTIRTHDQYNTTIYGLDDRYRGIRNERRVVLMNPEDMKEMGLRSKQKVDLTSHFQGKERHAPSWIVIPYKIPRRCLATYFPEANVLVPLDSVAERSNTPVSKYVDVTLSPHQPA